MQTRGTRGHRLARVGASIAMLIVGVGGPTTSASAGGQGAQTQTVHAHGANAYDLEVVDFLPIDSPPSVSLPEGCWMSENDALMSVDGNLVMHDIGNKTGGWFTSTFTGEAAVEPIVFASPGVPKLDQNGNDVLDTAGRAAATGHLTLWFGSEDNNKNGVEHATLTFTGIDVSGNPVALSGHFQIATNAAGDPTAVVGSLSC